MTSHSEFGHDTKATDVADAFPDQIKGRVVLITGVSKDGLGGATALAFARHTPSLLILVSRTKSKIDDVVASIAALNPAVTTKSILVDLASQDSVRRAAAEIKSLTPRIDLLINNAGLSVLTRTYSPEGLETQLAANHIGPFLLTNLLQEQLLEAAKHSAPGATRVINLSSDGHRMSPFRFHDYNNEGWPVPADETGIMHQLPDWVKEPEAGYVGMQAYAQSKTANVLFTVGLNDRLGGKGVVSYALHPGAIVTEMTRGFGNKMDKINEFLNSFGLKASSNEGASTTLVAAVDPALNEVKGTRVFLDDCQFKDAETHAVDRAIADRLWKLSEKLVKQTF